MRFPSGGGWSPDRWIGSEDRRDGRIRVGRPTPPAPRTGCGCEYVALETMTNGFERYVQVQACCPGHIDPELPERP